jgi:hypothetical protein
MPAFCRTAQICLRQICLELEDGVPLEDNGVTWHGHHISPLQSLTCMTRRRRGLCIPKDKVMPMTPDDTAKKSK